MSQLANNTQFIDASEARPLLLVGNPNVGKSLLFTRLTNRYVTVSNYPGTTVETTTATAGIGDERRSIIDTPGINSLLPQSEDEIVARDLLLRETNIDVMQVGDIANLRRTLLLTLQLGEYAVPFIVALNMADELRSADDGPDVAALSRAIGVPVISVSALRGWNISKLKQGLAGATPATMSVTYPAAIEAGITAIQALLKPASRGTALAILAGDATLKPFLTESCTANVLAQLDDLRAIAQRGFARPISVLISHCRVAAVDELLATLRQSSAFREDGFRERIGRVCMHPIYGIPILLGVLAAAWLLVGKIGAGTLVDLMQRQVFGRFINPWTIRGIDAIAPFPHTHVIADGVITAAYSGHAVSAAGRFSQTAHDLFVGPYGVVTMAITYAIAIVLPVVITFFTFFGLLEDSGYLPRLAVILNRGFRKIGLNGKAVLPMVLGLGCDTMATLTTRILDTKKEAAIVTLLLALGVPCSAQLGVIMAMLGPLGWLAITMWSGVTLLTIFLVGYAASKVMSGDAGEFVLEIPPVRVPKLSNILIKVLARTEWYIKEAVPLFILGTLVLYLLDAFHLLGALQRALSPVVVGGLGLPAESANAFVIGFLRRDYGAAGLYAMQRAGHLTPNQTVVALTVITLFIPCVANFLVMLRERGARTGFAMAAFIIVYAFGIGFAMNAALKFFGVIL